MKCLSGKMRAAAAITTLAWMAALAVPAAAAEDWTWPVRGQVLTRYSNDNSRPYAGGMHRGIDIEAAVGTAVVAARSGVVTFVGPLGSAGLTVAVRTSDSRYATSYLHLSAITVARGDAVESGRKLGEVGVTGKRSAEQPHLHFGVRLADSEHAYVDPLTLLPPLPEARQSPLPAPVSTPAVKALPAPMPAHPAPVRKLRSRSRLGSAPALREGILLGPVPGPQLRPAHARTAVATTRSAPSSDHGRQSVPTVPAPSTGPASIAAPRRAPRTAISPVPAKQGGSAIDWGRLAALAGCALLAGAALARRMGSALHLALSVLAATFARLRVTSGALASALCRWRFAAAARGTPPRVAP
jgi:hypothetical protein